MIYLNSFKTGDVVTFLRHNASTLLSVGASYTVAEVTCNQVHEVLIELLEFPDQPVYARSGWFKIISRKVG